MAGELLIRSATPEDTAEILNLVRLSLGEGKIPRHADYWSWKHEDNPFGRSAALVAEADGRLVGLRVFMRWGWRAEGASWRAVRAVDTATHPDWRGRGVFSRLTRALVERMQAEGVAFVFNTPNAQSRPGYLKMGWLRVGRTSIWVRPRNPLRLVQAFLAPTSDNGAASKAGAEVQGGCAAGELLRETGFPRFLEMLSAGDDRFSTLWSREYFQWRYASVPDVPYRVAWSLDGEHGAVVVFRLTNRRTLGELRVCDLLVGRSDQSRRIAQDLVRSVVHQVDAHYAIGMAASGTVQARVLFRCGFLPAPRVGPVMTVRPLSGATQRADPRRRSAWCLSVGDVELF